MDAATQENQLTNDNVRTLFKHDRRPQWGLAVVLWEREGKRGYQFADGTVRVIKDGFYDLFSPTTAPGDGSVRSLVRMALRRAGGDDTVLPTLRHQAAYMRGLYPQGFASPEWIARHRGGGRRLKRHRGPAVTTATKLWAREVLEAAVERGDWVAVHAAMVEVLSSTDLVTPTLVKKLKKAEATEELARSFVTLLHDENAVRAIDHFRKALASAGAPVSWPLVTAPRAVMHPQSDVCVRPSVWKTQARMVMPGFSPGTKPSAGEYAMFKKVAGAVRKELVLQDLAPVDMLDVYDFVWTTLRASVRGDVMGSLGGADEVAEAPEAA